MVAWSTLSNIFDAFKASLAFTLTCVSYSCFSLAELASGTFNAADSIAGKMLSSSIGKSKVAAASELESRQALLVVLSEQPV